MRRRNVHIRVYLYVQFSTFETTRGFKKQLFDREPGGLPEQRHCETIFFFHRVNNKGEEGMGVLEPRLLYELTLTNLDWNGF